MTSQAVEIPAIDLALASHYSGITIETGVDENGENGVVTPVSVFLEEPFTELYTERVYPSINIKYLGHVPDFEVSHTSDEDAEQVDYDTGVTPHETVNRESPLPYRVLYSIDTWHKVRAIEDRDLVTEAIIKKTKPRGYLTVSNIDGEDVTVWFFTDGSVVQKDEPQPDMVIYHKIVTVSILAYLSGVAFDDTVREKVVMKVNWEAVWRLLRTDEFGSEIVPAEDFTHLVWEFDDTTEGPV